MDDTAISILPPFNPLDKRNLAASIANALLERPVTSLPPDPFIGAGIYAIYYTGNFPLYNRIAECNANHAFALPIYVGKAVPAGARKGGLGLDAEPGMALCKRLGDHAKSIAEANNLRTEDFWCRFLAVDDIWIPLAESLLIEKFSPLWNRVLDGFGNHDPGNGRKDQQMSPWDTIHPGRLWAQKLKPNSLPAQVLEHQIIDFLTRHF